MYFTTDTKTLCTLLEKAMPFVGNSPVVPIISNLYVSLTGNLLSVTATDMESTITAREAIAGGADGTLAVPAKILSDIVHALPVATPITVSCDMATRTITLTCANGSYKITGEDPGDFPQPEQFSGSETIELPGEVLDQVLQKVAFAAGTDQLRPAMTGILFDFTKDGAFFVATDAHKLALLQSDSDALPYATRFIVPQKSLRGIAKAMHANADLPVKIEYNSVNAVFCIAAGTELHCRLLEGKYPDYKVVIPTANPIKVSVGKAELLKAVKRIKLFADKATATVCLSVTDNLLTLSAKNEDFGNEARETVPCTLDGEAIEICFNAQFLTESLQAICDEVVVLHLSAPHRPVLIYPEGGTEHFVLLMTIMKPN